MTWKELQETCLRKLFSLDEKEMLEDSVTRPYLYGMPAAANEAMLLLCAAGMPCKKHLTIPLLTETAEEENPPLPTERLGEWLVYDLAALTGDFYALDGIALLEGERYLPFTAYRMEGGSLLLPADKKGSFRIFYSAYPPKLTPETPPEEEIGLPEEAASMVALYMAGQLYKDDDITIAQIYMNEFLMWLEEWKKNAARARSKNADGGGWMSVKGWY